MKRFLKKVISKFNNFWIKDKHNFKKFWIKNQSQLSLDDELVKMINFFL